MKIAICFRGISRSLSHTISSIEENVYLPAKNKGEVKVFTHLFDQRDIDNPRSGEKGELNTTEYKLLKSDWEVLEPPNQFLAQSRFEELKNFGDPWKDNFSSVKNLLHELHSLKQGWQAAQEWCPDVYMFLRPDLMYHDSFEHVLQQIERGQKSGLCVPLWQGFGGCNDRFAIATTPLAASTYAQRIDWALDYCERTQLSLHAEKFLLFRIQEQSIPLWFMKNKASRVRSGGAVAYENYKFIRKSNLAIAWHAFKTGFAKQ
jgi:hypothetical protein